MSRIITVPGQMSGNQVVITFAVPGQMFGNQVVITFAVPGQMFGNQLYRFESPGISSDPSSAEVLGIFTDPNTSEYTDSNIDWATKYYYALKTTDTNDNSVWSNEDSISTPGTIPDSVVATVNVGNNPYGICSLPSGNYVYVVNSINCDVSVIH